MTKNKCSKTTIWLFLGLILLANFTFSQSSKNILVLGDSNGVLSYGWVDQLQKMVPKDKIYNTSKYGNSIGFDNLDKVELNTLKNLDTYLNSAQDSLKRIDLILIMLGTNDAKYIFKDKQYEVVINMNLLITRIIDYDYNFGLKPKIVIMSPPPYGCEEILEKKYKGGPKRVKSISRSFKKIAKNYDCVFVNVYKELKPVFNQYSADGVHLNADGQKIIAGLVFSKMN